jgi:RNA polymerase sigma factor (TIGR02999 family)
MIPTGNAPATLQPTDLVHEVFLKLFGDQPPSFADRQHFFATAATAMRSILIDYARYRSRAKRLAPGERVVLEQIYCDFENQKLDVLAINEALDKLHRRDPRLIQVVEMRLFCRFSVEQTTPMIGFSQRTVETALGACQGPLGSRLEPTRRLEGHVPLTATEPFRVA